jgi:capsid portal protein
MSKIKEIKMAGETEGSRNKASLMKAPIYDLFPKGAKNLLRGVNVKTSPPESNLNNDSTTSFNYTIYPQPISFSSVIKLKDISTHHNSCIQTKKYSTVGLGFYGDDEIVDNDKTVEEVAEDVEGAKANTTVAEIVSLLSGNQRVNSKVDDLLDPFTYFGFSNELMDATEDFMDTGTGYLEVAKDAEGTITGISHTPVADLWPAKMGNILFYVYRNPNGSDKFFALFGRKDELIAKYPDGSKPNPEDVSEIIPFIMPSNRVKFYGYADWLAAVVDIDLTAMAKQYKADFYSNRGVLDFLISVLGTSVDDKQWAEIKGIASGAQGAGKNYRNGAINLTAENASVQVDKLAMDMNTEEQFAKDVEVLSQNIVSAHRTPPLLANILIPGKLGATNEFINALIAYQLLTIGPYQQIIQSQLGRTLGNSDFNGGLDLDADSFRLRTLTSQINITGLDAVSRSRTEATDGDTNNDRDYEDGVKE